MQKSILRIIDFLFSLTETGGPQAAPIVTVSTS
jgi:hypothetical protein